MRQTGKKGSIPSFVIITAVGLFFAFCVYYVFTAWHLPWGAGPDSGAHHDIARFIYDEGRLATVPEDVERLKLTPYGSTRALRPPLSYLVSAGIARLVKDVGHDTTFVNLRFGSGFLCAAAAAFLFLGLWMLYERYWISLTGALLFGMLPQLAFIASYVNDDSGAIFSGTMLLFAMICLLVRGLGAGTSIVFGLAAGLALLSKFTAWLMLPLAACFLLPRLWKAQDRRLKYTALIGAAVIIGGGWWILFNMYHYGIGDPLLFGAAAELSEQRAVIKDAGQRGYDSIGIGASELILENYKNFLGETFKATVGHLDWLRIRLGWPQYGLYGVVFLIGVLYAPVRSIREWVGLSAHHDPQEPPGMSWFCGILFLMVVFQLVMYLRFNLYHDIQVQGKYLLPVLAPAITLYSAAVVSIADYLGARVRDSDRTLEAALIVLSLAVIAGSHLHALFRYVIPYYHPDPFVFRLSPFRYVDMSTLGFVKAARNAELQLDAPGVIADSTGIDPQIVLRDDYCEWFSVNTIIHVVLQSEQKGEFKVYLDDGRGFSEEKATGWRYHPGENHLIMPVGISRCAGIRIDPASAPGRVKISRIGFAPVHISQ